MLFDATCTFGQYIYFIRINSTKEQHQKTNGTADEI